MPKISPHKQFKFKSHSSPIRASGEASRSRIKMRNSNITSSNPDKPTMPSIPKGLVIGYDNWANMTPEGMAKTFLKFDNTNEFKNMIARAKPNATDEEATLWLKEYLEGVLSRTPVVVKAAHPRADDDTVRYTCIPDTPWGELIIRWWADTTYGYCFDLVDIGQQKIRAIPKDIQFVLKTGYGLGSVPLETLEEAHRLSNLGPPDAGNARVEYPLNADGIVEERYAVNKGACLGLYKRGTDILIALVVGPEATFVSGPLDVPVYHSFSPV